MNDAEREQYAIQVVENVPGMKTLLQALVEGKQPYQLSSKMVGHPAFAPAMVGYMQCLTWILAAMGLAKTDMPKDPELEAGVEDGIRQLMDIPGAGDG